MDWFKEIKIIGWDLDGTLYPTSRQMWRAVERLRNKRVADKLQVDEKVADYKYQQELARLGSHTETLSFLGIDGVDFFTSVWDSLALEKYIKTDERVGEMFGKLNNYRHFLLTNSNRMDQVEKKLKLIGLSQSVFELVATSVDIGVNKPHRRAFEFCLERLNVGVWAKQGSQEGASAVLYVGDRLETDVRGAKAVGMRTCLLGEESDEADMWVKEVLEVGRMLGR